MLVEAPAINKELYNKILTYVIFSGFLPFNKAKFPKNDIYQG